MAIVTNKKSGVKNRVAEQLANQIAGAAPAGEQLAALWHVLGNAAGKQGVRDDLPSGCGHTVSAIISGEVDGNPFAPIKVDAVLTVGHDSERATSQTPNANGLLAFALGKMNPATRAAVMSLALAAVEAGEDYPASECAEEAELFLKKLRAAKPITVRGSVSTKYTIG